MNAYALLRNRRFLAPTIILMALMIFWIIGRSTVMNIPRLNSEIDSIIAPTVKEKTATVPEVEPVGEVAGQQFLGSNDMISPPVLPTLGDRIIRYASLSLKVKEGRFDQAHDRAVMLATANGGYVAASNINSSNGKSSGTITIKIPNDNFEKAMTDLKKLGKVRTVNVGSQDVTQEFVDLESRLRHLKAQESIMLGIMAKAETITDSITIQSQLSQIQQQIEQITGRLNFLEDQTEFSTINVSLNESEVVYGQPVDKWGLKAAVERAVHAFVITIGGFVVALGYILPLVIISAFLYGLYSLLRRLISKSAVQA